MLGSSSTIRIRGGMVRPPRDGTHRARNVDREPRPGAGRVLGPHPAADRIQQSARDRQAHAGARRRLLGAAPAIEALEQVIQLAGIESRTVIGDGDRDAVRLGPRIDDDVAIGGRVARGILEQMRQARPTRAARRC